MKQDGGPFVIHFGLASGIVRSPICPDERSWFAVMGDHVDNPFQGVPFDLEIQLTLYAWVPRL